jgi:hypothetical protein
MRPTTIYYPHFFFALACLTPGRQVYLTGGLSVEGVVDQTHRTKQMTIGQQKNERHAPRPPETAQREERFLQVKRKNSNNSARGFTAKP